MTIVEMTILDNGYPLSVVESVHSKYCAALSHAAKCAREYSARYPESTWRKAVGGFFIIADKSGKTFAQFAVLA